MTSATRFALKPDAATLVGAGVTGHVMSAWIGLMAPAGTPAAVINAVQRETAEGLKDPAVQKRLADMGVVGGGSLPADFARYLSAERETYRKLSAQTGLKVD